MTTRALGIYGEDLAVQFLREKGYQILERNFRNKLGEIDVVTKDGPTVCFVEVKTRQSLVQGMPYESVHHHKQRQMARMALSYLKYRFHTIDIRSRFDVISIYKDESGKEHIQHIPHAFDLTYLYGRR
jgi:putative endonuclease